MTKPDPSTAIETLAAQILGGDRRSLGKAITLCESTKIGDEPAAEKLLEILMPKSGGSIRLGISGPPGAGKSTFIEAIGTFLLKRGKTLAVLAIDPTSPVSGGSIMGDKTRMESLSVSPQAFVRPSPSGLVHGGVARHTRESLLICEAAGFDVVMIETVGVGQSDVVVASMVDVFIMLQQPYAGDELQGIKRGILELADMICITKADGPTATGAAIAKGELERALAFGYGKRDQAPQIILVSNTENIGLQDVWTAVQDFESRAKVTGQWSRRREEQARSWFEDEIMEVIRHRLKASHRLEMEFSKIQDDVKSLKLPASIAARRLVDRILKTSDSGEPS